MPTVHSAAPNFSLPDQDGKIHTLADQKGHWVLLYFYPKDDTPGCTKESCGLRDALKKYQEMDCRIFGVSADTAESHKAFAEKFSLPFPLLADPQKSVIQAYGAWGEKTSYGQTRMGILRISYLIDPEGKIAKAYPKVSPEEHADQVLADLQAYATTR